MKNEDAVMAYLAITYDGNWLKMISAMEKNIPFSNQEVINATKNLDCKYLSIVNPKYPSRWDNVPDGPIILFYQGNYGLINEKLILVVSHLNQQNIKYLKALKRNAMIPMFNNEWIDENDFDLLLENKIPFVLCVRSLFPIDNQYLKQMIDNKQALVISESYHLHEPDYVVWQYPRLLTISGTILFLSDYMIRDQSLVDFIHKKQTKLFVICNSSQPYLSDIFPDIFLIHSLKNFQIVINYLNKNY